LQSDNAFKNLLILVPKTRFRGFAKPKMMMNGALFCRGGRCRPRAIAASFAKQTATD
jgi:hypothetical protein